MLFGIINSVRAYSSQNKPFFANLSEKLRLNKGLVQYLSKFATRGDNVPDWNLVLIANKPTLYFVYGLSFFILGVAIFIQQRKVSRLKLAKTLRWLALFAVIHGLAEWGYLFIPLNEPYLSPQTVQGLKVAQVLMWMLSFFFLICFGLAFFPNVGKWRYLLWPTGAVISGLFFALWWFDHSISFWLTGYSLEITARYALCIPGAFLGAVGLFRQRGELRELGSKKLLRYLELAALCFACYAVAGGLVVPAAGFFPANIINNENFREVFGIPVELLRAALGALMAFSILNVLAMYDLEDGNRMSEMKRREALNKERERISRDLHDGVIQSIYGIGLILQKLKKTGAQDSQWSSHLETVLHGLDELVTEIREYIQNLRHDNSFDRFVETIKGASTDPALPLEINTNGNNWPSVSPLALEHIRLIVREALTNVSKHAEASKASITFHTVDNGMQMIIEDNGHGIIGCGVEGTGKKLGLNNIRERAACLNGNCDIDWTDQGTCVRIWIPWEGNVIA